MPFSSKRIPLVFQVLLQLGEHDPACSAPVDLLLYRLQICVDGIMFRHSRKTIAESPRLYGCTLA